MAQIDLKLKFSSDKIKAVFEDGHRNIAVCGGLGSGKTYGICQKIIALMLKFPGYRWAAGRLSSTALKRTTMQTFIKACPPELYDPAFGGKKVDSNPPYLDFVNGSRIYWMHFDQDIGNLLSLEINGAFIDQAEEVPEDVYLMLDSRVGRWDEVKVPEDLLALNPNWPRNKFTNRPLAPSYNIVAFNPPDEGIYSYLYQYFHPESELWQEKFRTTHSYHQISSRDNEALSEENLKTLLSRDEEWVDRYVTGNFHQGAGAIHRLPKQSVIEYNPKFVEFLLKKATLTRVLDHGTAAPTCCLWFATYKGMHFCYREYYQPNKLISEHRKAIAELSRGEYYSANLADPSIFRRETQKNGGWWSVYDEYTSGEYDSPTINWTPADNNEFATRNRINELLAPQDNLKHPLTGESPAPRLYFIRKSEEYPYGAANAYRELTMQKKTLLAEVQGKKIYSDEREKSIADHAYDAVRYYVSLHLRGDQTPLVKVVQPGSFLDIQKRIKAVNRYKALKNAKSRRY